MMVMRDIACMALTTVKVAPRAPKFWEAILMVVLTGVWEVGLEGAEGS